MNIIIPASGIGKRFIEAGYKETKPLIDVVDKKILDYVLDSFDRKNDMFYIITSKQTYDDVQKFLETANIKYKHILTEAPKLGPVGAIVDAYHALDSENLDDVIVSYCDYGMEWDYEDFKNLVNTTEYDGIIPCYTGYHPHLEPEENVYAVCKKFDNSNEVYEVIEKYKSNDRFNESWSAGLYYFRSYEKMKESFKNIIEAEDTLNNEYYVSMAYNYLDGSIYAYDEIKKFYQFGTPKDFENAKENLIKRTALINDKAEIKNTIILSAGMGERFFNLGYKQPKPFIPLGDSDFVTHITKTFKNVDTNIRYIGSDAHKVFWELSELNNVKLIPSNKIGAAYSYNQGCSDIDGEALIVPCDLLGKHVNEKFLELKNDADAIIFTSDPSEYMLENKESFAWVDSDKDNVTNITIKEYDNPNQKVLIGSFWVKDNAILLKNIDEIFDKKLTVNNEYYLDMAFKNMINNNLKVKSVNISYFSLGTPTEYKENEYWLEGALDD